MRSYYITLPPILLMLSCSSCFITTPAATFLLLLYCYSAAILEDCYTLAPTLATILILGLLHACLSNPAAILVCIPAALLLCCCMTPAGTRSSCDSCCLCTKLLFPLGTRFGTLCPPSGIKFTQKVVNGARGPPLGGIVMHAGHTGSTRDAFWITPGEHF